jgi:hypothetical protein
MVMPSYYVDRDGVATWLTPDETRRFFEAWEDVEWEPYGAVFSDKRVALALVFVLQQRSLFEFRVVGATRFQIERRRKH